MLSSEWQETADKTNVPYELATFIPVTLVVAFGTAELDSKTIEEVLNFTEQTFSNECTRVAQILEVKHAPTFAGLPRCFKMFGPTALTEAIGKDNVTVLQCMFI
jgi:hypothetical protein